MINRVLGMSHLDYVTLNKKGAKVHDHKSQKGNLKEPSKHDMLQISKYQ